MPRTTIFNNWEQLVERIVVQMAQEGLVEPPSLPNYVIPTAPTIVEIQPPTTLRNPMERKSPPRRSMLILLSKIGFRKFRQFKKKGYFEEPCQYGTLRFYSHDVELIETRTYGTKQKRLCWQLCINPTVPVPNGDVILSRWLAFKADPDSFFDTANFLKVCLCEKPQ